MTVIMCATWIVLFVLTAVAFWEGKIFNSKPEDVIRDMYYADEKLQVKDIERRLSVVERSMHRITSRDDRTATPRTVNVGDGCEMVRMTTRGDVLLPTLPMNDLSTSPTLTSEYPPPPSI